MGEEHCSERAGHGWPALVLQAEQDAKAKQGKYSAQGRVHSASSWARRRNNPGLRSAIYMEAAS